MVYYYEYKVEDKKSDKEEHTINICTRKESGILVRGVDERYVSKKPFQQTI